ncbi:MAG: hypothetical protein ACJAZ8_001658 [Planctomycetota bacterium]|jgi:hypothetical protein
MLMEESAAVKERSELATIGYSIVGQVAIWILVTFVLCKQGGANHGTGMAVVGAWGALGLLCLPALLFFHWRHPRHFGLSVILALFSTLVAVPIGMVCSVLVMGLTK